MSVSAYRRGSPPWRAIAAALLGVWLIASAFLLSRGVDSRTNCWLVGAVIVIAALASVHSPIARHAVAAAATWLFFSAFAIFLTGTGTLLHDLLVAFAVFSIALMPAAAARRFRGFAPSPGPSTAP